jgi:signal peptide peptidase SppA
MRYPLIAAKVTREPWALRPEVFSAILDALNGRIAQLTTAPRQPIAIAYIEDADDDDDGPEMHSLGSVAVIPVHGILGKHLSALEMECGGCSIDALSALLTAADLDPDCHTIVLAFNSPGGTVTGIPELSAKILDIADRKPVVAFTDNQCCSAALWLASACTAFYTTESALVGSVGVYTLVLDESAALEKEGVKVEAMSAGKFKLAGAPFKPLTAEERALFQARVDDLNAQFHAAVTRARSIADADLQGQTFTGTEAVTRGFCDGLVADLDECLEVFGPPPSRLTSTRM